MRTYTYSINPLKVNFLVWVFRLWLLVFGGSVLAQSPYTLQTGRELRLLGIGAVTGGAALITEQNLNPLTAAEIAALHSSDINSFDRRAVSRYNPTAATYSNVALAATAAELGFLTLGTTPMRQDIKTVAVMGVEMGLLANGLLQTVKNVTQRTRPYAYNPAVPLAEKLNRETRQSFFSGHATNAFAVAVFTGEVFRHYFPASRWKPVVWIGALGLATGTAFLRYDAGKHYPTDLLAGAAVGALAGWAIPKLHETRAYTSLTLQPWSNGQANGISAQWLLFSR